MELGWIITVVLCLLVQTCGCLDIRRPGRQAGGSPGKCMTYQDTMTTCMGPLGGASFQSGGGYTLLSDLNATRTLCRAGKLQDAMSCLEDVYNACVTHSSSRALHSSDLNMMIDVGKWQQGIHVLCDKIDYLLDNEVCTERIRVKSSHCILQESREFQQAVASLNTRAKEDNDQAAIRKQMLAEMCKFATQVIWCFKTPLDREASCPCIYRELVIDVVAESMPPFCKIDASKFNSSLTTCKEHEEEEETKEEEEKEEEQEEEDDEGGQTEINEEVDTDQEDWPEGFSQYEGFSVADPNKIKVFEAGEFVPTNLLPLEHLDYHDMGDDMMHQEARHPAAKADQDSRYTLPDPPGTAGVGVVSCSSQLSVLVVFVCHVWWGVLL